MEPFYGKEIHPGEQQNIVNKILSKYSRETVSDELKKKIHDELTAAKWEGIITIPFKVSIRKDVTGIHRDFIEVILDTKV